MSAFLWKERRAIALAMLAGAALGASFIDFRLFVLPWLALPLLIALAEQGTPRRAFALGYAAGLAGITIAFSWIVHAVRVFGGFPWPVALAIFTAPVAWMALEIAVIMGLLAWIGPLPLGLAPPLVFTAVEFLFPSLFPWRLAHSQYRVPLLLQSGDLAGSSLLTFAIVWTAAGLHAVVGGADRSRDAWRALRGTAPPLLLLAVLLGYGYWRLAQVTHARTSAPPLRVGLVQGNVDVVRKGDRNFFGRNLETYRALSRGLPADVDLVIWPETVVQHRLDATRAQLMRGEDPFPDAVPPLLFGGLAEERGTAGTHLFNSAFLVQHGAVVGRYDKRMLVPFGEYMPLGDRVKWLNALSPATSHFTAGVTASLLPVGPHARIAALVCYEDVIAGLAREVVARGATLLVNLTNDAWYGDSAEPVQHQALAVWRAVENRRDLIRATNTGLTSVIAATGEVVAELTTFTPASLTTDVRLLEGRTVYNTIGDAFAWATVAVLAVVMLVSRRGRP